MVELFREDICVIRRRSPVLFKLCLLNSVLHIVENAAVRNIKKMCMIEKVLISGESVTVPWVSRVELDTI